MYNRARQKSLIALFAIKSNEPSWNHLVDIEPVAPLHKFAKLGYQILELLLVSRSVGMPSVRWERTRRPGYAHNE